MRVELVQTDLKPWFPFQKAYYRTGDPSSIQSLYLSCVSIENILFGDLMETEDRILQIKDDRVKIGVYSKYFDGIEIPWV
jgi:hypothetical protein